MGAGLERGRSIPACRPSPTARSAPRTSSSPTRRNVYIGQAAHCSGTGGNTATNGCDARLAPDRHAGRRRRRQQARHDGLQLVDHDAGPGRDRPRHLRSTTTSRWSSSTRPTRPRSTRRSRFWGGPTGSAPTTRAARQGLLVRQLRAARRRHPAEPEGGLQPRRRRRRLEPQRLHRDAGHPRRLGQRVPRQHGRGARHPQHGRDRAARRLQRRRRRRQGARLRAAPTASAACSWRRHRALRRPARCRRTFPGRRGASPAIR